MQNADRLVAAKPRPVATHSFMRCILLLTAGVFLGAESRCLAQLTPDQKVADFMDLAGLYAKNYAPYGWKVQVFGYDLLNLGPWLSQVQSTTNDLDYYDVCVRYVASLNDSHDEYTLNTDFAAYLPFMVDIYDGKTLIDLINWDIISPNQYPFGVGDELVSVDGVAAADLIQSFLPYAVNAHGNPATAKRVAAFTITTRYQSWYPYALKAGSTSVIEVRNHSSNNVTAYTVPWVTSGLPLTGDESVPGFSGVTSNSRSDTGSWPRRKISRGTAVKDNAWKLWTGPPADLPPESVPAYLEPLKAWQLSMALGTQMDYASFGAPAPVFNPPPGFNSRLGSQPTDQFVSGTFSAGPKQVGFIRISTMQPADEALALSQFQNEIAWFAQNTDALVVDVMRNGGGDLCYTQQLLQSLMPAPFRGFAYDIRSSWDWVTYFNSALETAQEWRADAGTISQYQAYVQALQSSMANGALTGPLPVCGASFANIPPAVDASGNMAAYSKPLVVLVDGLTLSAAEAFAMALQDEKRATIFGIRTDGGGGNPVSMSTTYADAATRVTRTFITRKTVTATPGFPASDYIENTGVYPDIVTDYMTRDNLLGNGAPFVAAFTSAVANLTGVSASVSVPATRRAPR